MKLRSKEDFYLAYESLKGNRDLCFNKISIFTAVNI